jgi:hypothetical protein
VLPIKKKAAIISSEFSSPKQLEKNYASSITKASPHPWDTKQTVATNEKVVASSEDSNVLPTIDVQEKDVTLCAVISSSFGNRLGILLVLLSLNFKSMIVMIPQMVCL